MITEKNNEFYFYNWKLRKFGPYESVEEMYFAIAEQAKDLEDESNK